MKLEIIHAYTRAQAIADGLQIEVTTTAQEAGLRVPVFLTQSVYAAFVTVPPGVMAQDEAGRLWDIVWMLRFAIQCRRNQCDHLTFELCVRNDNLRPAVVKLVAVCGPLDKDNPQPAITVMLPDED